MKIFLLAFVLFIASVAITASALAGSANSDILAGNEAAVMENYELAITYYNKAINSGQLNNKQLAVVYNNRGCAYDDSGQEDLALKDFDKAIRLDSSYDAPYYSRSFIYERRQQYAKAIADMQKAVNLDSSFEDYKVRLEWLREQTPKP